MSRIAVKLGKIALKNPVTVASGTFGYEYNRYYDLNLLGAVVTKTITKHPKEGNPPPRLVETPAGLINSIGLQNPGLESFCSNSLVKYKELLDDSTPLIVSFSGSTITEFSEMTKRLEAEDGIAGYEVNISCPNVEKEGISFGVDPAGVYQLTKQIRSSISSEREFIVKLSPNVTDITEIAKAAVAGGCDSLALINTLIGMKIDWQTGKTLIGRGFGGLSGPAVMPVALYNVYKVAQAVNVPILAMGGISTYHDALEFFYAGASAIALGTANFVNPLAAKEVIEGLERHCQQEEKKITDFIGKVKIGS